MCKYKKVSKLPKENKSRKWSIISLKDHVGEGMEGINDMTSSLDAHVDKTHKIKSLQTSLHLHNLFQHHSGG